MSGAGQFRSVEVRPSLGEQIYARLRQEIVAGRLRPGERLIELSIAKRFGVSQAPVREALRRLSQEGLAVGEPRRGTRIRELTLSDIQEIYEVRAELEVYAARRFVERLSPGASRMLRRAYADLARASRAEDQAAMLEQDIALHEAVCRGADSAVLLETWSGVIGRWRGMRAIVASQWPQPPAQHLASHDPIVKTLLDGALAEAQEAVRTHLERAFTELREYLTAAAPADRLYREE